MAYQPPPPRSHDFRHDHYHCRHCGCELEVGPGARVGVLGRFGSDPYDGDSEYTSTGFGMTQCPDCLLESADDAMDEYLDNLYNERTSRIELFKRWNADGVQELEKLRERESTVEGLKISRATGLTDFANLPCVVKKCRGCTRLVYSLFSEEGSYPTYCSQYCRWRSYKGGERGNMRCGWCGEVFLPKSRKAKFCGNSCRGKAHRAKVNLTDHSTDDE